MDKKKRSKTTLLIASGLSVSVLPSIGAAHLSQATMCYRVNVTCNPNRHNRMWITIHQRDILALLVHRIAASISGVDTGLVCAAVKW